ncbi:MAG: YdcF family protein [Lachnospiraceae bacterium]|nr:YdcF family protein [Lachnospiraceae bacterium]
MTAVFYDAITDFIFVENQPEKSDMIFIPGSFRPELALRAAQLYHAGYAPFILPSGKHSILSERTGQAGVDSAEGSSAENFSGAENRAVAENRVGAARACMTESDYLCDIMKSSGVPEQALLREPQATFTWENAIYSRQITDAAGLYIRKAILCCKAFHARRCLMYYQQQFPETRFLVCPVIVDGISRDQWYRTKKGIDTVLGEVERCGGQFYEILYDQADL